MAHYVKKNGVLTPLNGRSAQDYLEAKGRIVVDISNQQVGDVIRVRSLLDPTQVWNKEITELGDYMVFDVPCKDLYKVCMVVDSVEVGDFATTIDYGQIALVNMLDKKTLAGVQNILNAHQETEYLAIGDEVNVTIDGVDEVYQIAAIDLYDTHEVIFAAKYIASIIVNTPVDYGGRTDVQNYLSELYTSMADKDKKYVKDRTLKYGYTGSNSSKNLYTITKKIWIPATNEAYQGQGNISIEVSSGGLKQFPLFSTAASRIKTPKDGVAAAWQLTSSSYYNYTDFISTNGDWNYGNSNQGVLPCFHLTADI